MVPAASPRCTVVIDDALQSCAINVAVSVAIRGCCHSTVDSPNLRPVPHHVPGMFIFLLVSCFEAVTGSDLSVPPCSFVGDTRVDRSLGFLKPTFIHMLLVPTCP